MIIPSLQDVTVKVNDAEDPVLGLDANWQPVEVPAFVKSAPMSVVASTAAENVTV